MTIYSHKGQLIKTRWVIFVDKQFKLKHTFHIQNPSIYLFITTLAHMLNGYEIWLNKQTIRFSICKISYIGYAPPF